MANSPLYGAALASPGLISGNGGVFQDPTYWPVQRRMGLAQALMGEGLSSAPAYPMQALARVAQAGLGAWMENRAEQQLQDTIAKQGAEAVAAYQGALGGLGGALMSPPASTAAPLPPAPVAPSYGGGGPGASVEMPKEYAQYYADASKRTGIPVEVLQAKDRQESGFNPGATGAAGEIGIAQISPKTAASPGFGMTGVRNPDILRDPRTNIDFGADYLAARAGNIDWHNPVAVAAALKAYNGGGDPEYAAHVMRYLPQSYAMATGQQPPAAQAPPPGAPTPEQMAAMPDQQWLQQQAKTYPGLVRPWDVAAGGNTASDAQPEVPMPGAAAGGGGASAPAPQAQGAPQPQQVAQGAPSAGPQQPQMPATGAQSPSVAEALRLQQMATEMRLRNPYNVQVQTLAHGLEQRAQVLMGLDTFTTVQTANGPMSVNQRTGEPKYLLPETPRPVTDQQGRTWVLHPGGGATLLSDNPTGIAGNEPENVQLRTLSTLGAKLNAGQALTPQELQTYLNTATAWQQFRADRNPNTGGIEMHPTRPLPPGIPNIGLGQASPQMPGTAGVVSMSPGLSPAQQGAERKLGEDFATVDKKAYDNANASLGMLTSMNNSAEILNATPGGWAAPGAGANARLEIGKSLNQVSGLFGGQPVVDPEKVGSWELLNKQTKLMGMQVINAYFGGSREAASIINGATSAVPNAENSYLGFRMVSSGIEQDLQRQRDLYEFKAQRLSAGQPLATAETDFNKAHPVAEYTTRAIANAVPDNVAQYLLEHPDTVGDFDKHFGKGIGEFVLKGGRSALGASAGATHG